MSIEAHFDVPFIAALALREKQIQQNYRPVIAVHKWFARRPGTLFRGLTLAEFGEDPLELAFYRTNSFPGRAIGDPFMGGGTPILEANRVGCDVVGLDINPMAAWIVREEIQHVDQAAYRQAGTILTTRLAAEVGDLYRTRCIKCGTPDASVKYFLWVKTHDCSKCGNTFDLFQGYLLAENKRHPLNVLICAGCGQLNEVADPGAPGSCRECHRPLQADGPAKRNRCKCPACHETNSYPAPNAGPPKHRLFAIEYHCEKCKPRHAGRFFKRPDTDDLARVSTAEARWQRTKARFVPSEEIPSGDETDRLHRWGYRSYRELFNARQLLGLETSARIVSEVNDDRLQRALATNLSDLLRYQNMLCRYDTMALKSLDVFSIHGFPVGHVQCESNLLGIAGRNGSNIGSGGWSNIIDKYAKAKAYCDEPFEMMLRGSRKVQVPVAGEWIGERRGENGAQPPRKVVLKCRDAAKAKLRSASLDAVFTDPPYLGNVQYGELMDFCYVWLRRLVGEGSEGFDRASTRNSEELTGNATLERGLAHFTEGLAATFRNMARALKPGAPLAFTYHHNRQEAYCAAGVAMLDAGLTCSASLPCPAEMGGSIHIHGTGSSIVDTVFVCRSTGWTRRRWMFDNAEELARLVKEDLSMLCAAGLKPSAGDCRCIIYGHLTRMAAWGLRKEWRLDAPIESKLEAFDAEMRRLANLSETMAIVQRAAPSIRRRRFANGSPQLDSRLSDAVSFGRFDLANKESHMSQTKGALLQCPA